MPDRKTVVKGLRDISGFVASRIGFEKAKNFMRTIDDAIVMLEEREVVKPKINEDGEAFCECGENVGIIPSSKQLPSVCMKFCPGCGKPILWESR